MGSCCSALSSVEEAESSAMFKRLDVNNDKKACREEISAFVASRPELWAMLSINLGISEDKCRETATRVAMELASGKEGPAALETELTPQQFHQFRQKYMLNGQGAQEFFHRCVFASFDHDNNNLLDTDELDAFLDTFYKAGSIFLGDSRLPKKTVLKQNIIDKYSTRDDNMLSFDELRDIIRGTGAGTTKAKAALPTPQPKEQAQKKKDQKDSSTPATANGSRSGNNQKQRKPLAPRDKADLNANTSGSNKNESSTSTNPNGKVRKRRPKQGMDIPVPTATATNSSQKDNQQLKKRAAKSAVQRKAKAQ